MARKPSDSRGSGRIVILVAVALASCCLAYVVLSTALRRPAASSQESAANSRRDVGSRPSDGGDEDGECCRGMEHLELWGSAVKWGTDHRFNSSRDCCRACKAMCRGADGPCLCDSWVFCGDRERCGEKFGECWLKKQKDSLFPALQEFGDKVIWTSGLVFGKGEGIVGLETDHGTIHIKLLPECAPNSVEYIAQLLESRHCAGCRFYRAESRGNAWDSEGNHIADIADVWSCGVTLYVMLVGSYPFEDPEDPRNFRKTIARILSVQYTIPDYVRVSAECRHLLSKIFVANPSKRITIPEIKKNPWFLKNLPKEIADGEKTNYRVSERDEASQSVEEIMSIIQEAKTPGEGSHAIDRSALGLEDGDDLDADVDTEDVSDSGDFSALV